jgi:hypothetical protein
MYYNYIISNHKMNIEVKKSVFEWNALVLIRKCMFEEKANSFLKKMNIFCTCRVWHNFLFWFYCRRDSHVKHPLYSLIGILLETKLAFFIMYWTGKTIYRKLLIIHLRIIHFVYYPCTTFFNVNADVWIRLSTYFCAHYDLPRSRGLILVGCTEDMVEQYFFLFFCVL